MKQPSSEYRDTRLWETLEAIFAELNATGEVTVNTAPDYAIAHICRELAAKKLITTEALSTNH
ncbi:MAG TPA: hypothetical protein VGQ56_07870 [Gemmatimonadaceae bacterium]|nr:hypothetical protein [Gemmatimonadaceae bacterium]